LLRKSLGEEAVAALSRVQMRTNGVTESEAMNRDRYLRARSVLLEARSLMKEEGMTTDEMLVVFADFLAALALSRGGEETARQTMEQILRHVQDWKARKPRAQNH
jgi:hypothetical protein